MKRFLAFDGINCEHEEFETIAEAQEWLKEAFFDENECCYHPDLESCKIYELREIVKYNVVDRKSNHTVGEWEEKHGDDVEEIWEHKFEDVKRGNAEDFVVEWCNRRYGEGKEIGTWTTDEVMRFANDFAKNKK